MKLIPLTGNINRRRRHRTQSFLWLIFSLIPFTISYYVVGTHDLSLIALLFLIIVFFFIVIRSAKIRALELYSVVNEENDKIRDRISITVTRFTQEANFGLFALISFGFFLTYIYELIFDGYEQMLIIKAFIAFGVLVLFLKAFNLELNLSNKLQDLPPFEIILDKDGIHIPGFVVKLIPIGEGSNNNITIAWNEIIKIEIAEQWANSNNRKKPDMILTLNDGRKIKLGRNYIEHFEIDVIKFANFYSSPRIIIRDELEVY